MAEENFATADDGEGTSASQSGQRPISQLPFIITLVALLLFFAFQTLSLLTERANLASVKSNQDGALQEAQKVQAQFRLLVSKTGELADQGHAGAKMIMEGLQRQGIGFAPETKVPESKMPTKSEPSAPAKTETKAAK